MIRRRHPPAVDERPEAEDIARDLDNNHPADPGELQDIGTCRTCGLLIVRNENGTWSHLPSVDEADQAGRWIDRHDEIKQDGAHSPGSGVDRIGSRTRRQSKE